MRIGFGDFCSISPQRLKTSIFRGCLILDNTPSIASIIPDDADDVMHAGDAGDAGDAVPQVGPILPKTCNLKILKSKVDENGWKMAWIEILKS